MDTTIVIEAWTSAITPMGLVFALMVQAAIVASIMVIGHALGKESK